MTSVPIIPQFSRWPKLPSRIQRFLLRIGHPPACRNPYQLAQWIDRLPRFVRDSAVAMRYLRLLSPLAWHRFPERNLLRNWGQPAVPYAPFAAAYLVKLDQGIGYISKLREYLVEHPALTWVLGFPLQPSRRYSWGFDVDASLPTYRHFTRMLRTMPNTCLQFLLDETVYLLQVELCAKAPDFGQCISLDTKLIIAWVKENNHKAYVTDRYDKTKQPPGDPDCRLGCKRRRNQRTSSEKAPPTPTDNPVPASTTSVGEYYWGYGSGVVGTKAPGWGEFVLAELTQPFNRSDVSYFFPLMADIERRLGFRPRYGAFDAAFDAHYVYDHFCREDGSDGFAAVPFSLRGGYRREFDESGLPLCKAGLGMPLKSTYWSKTSLVEHECGSYVCPLLFPEPTGEVCPIDHKNWPKGCLSRMPTNEGARVRYQLDRQSPIYKAVYKQRTATERINSQAKALGIETPNLRNGGAITNQNTLIYVLINLRALHRVRQQKALENNE
jgi:hypothetical protein